MSSERIIRPLALSELAAPLLRGAAPLVQAVHHSGVSLVVPAHPGICFLNAPGNGLLPLHVVVRHTDLAWLISRLETGDRLNLDLDGVRVFQLTLAAAELQAPRPQAAVERVRAWLLQRTEPCGLGESVDHALSPLGLLSRTLAAVETDLSSAEAALRRLIGRGSGSTPAGDDMLVGAMAYAHASDAGRCALINAMHTLMPEFDQLTTAAGATYLRAAVQGDFGGDLLAFIRSLPRPPAETALRRAMRVAEHGATSGIDTLLGFVAAHEAARPGYCSA